MVVTKEVIVIGKNEKPRSMDVLSEAQIQHLETLLKDMDSRLYIYKIDYHLGIIGLGYIRNKGTEDEWYDDEFIEVNVAMESVPCMLWEVVNKVFHKCIC